MSQEKAEQTDRVDSTTLQDIKARTPGAKLVDEFEKLLKEIPESEIVLTPAKHSNPSHGPTIVSVAVGGYSDIYRGVMTSGGVEKEVAIKVFRGAHLVAVTLDAREKYHNRLRREYAVWGELNHRNILPLEGLVIMPTLTSAGLVSEFKDHGNLVDFMKKDVKYDRLDMAQGVACGLEYLHSKDLVHGDLTPANILVDRDPLTKTFYPLITDFGKSRILEQDGYTTRVDKTPMIAKPPELLDVCDDEEATNKVYLTLASDVYSFSLVLLKLLTGKDAYSQEKLAAWRVSQRIVDKANPLRPVPEKYRLLDPKHAFCWDLMEACWSPNKEDRITSRDAHQWLCDGSRPSHIVEKRPTFN